MNEFMTKGLKLLDKSNRLVDPRDIFLGTVDVGDTQEYEYYLLNATGTVVKDIQCKTNIQTNEVKILSCPKELKNQEKGLFKFSFTPDYKIKSGLKLEVVFRGREIWS